MLSQYKHFTNNHNNRSGDEVTDDASSPLRNNGNAAVAAPSASSSSSPPTNNNNDNNEMTKEEQLSLTLQYVKSIIIQFLRAQGQEEMRLRMLPALGKALQFNNAEKIEIRRHIPNAQF